MARIEGAKRRGLVVRIVLSLIRRKLGKDSTPWRIKAHHPALFMGSARMEQALAKSHRVDEGVKLLAQVRTSTLLGCPN
jgi:hypothetical protein